MEYDRTQRLFDEPHAPAVLEAQVKKGTINQGKFLSDAHAGSYLCQMRSIHRLGDVSSCFEVGPGEHFVARNLRALGYTYDTLDFEAAHEPTIVADFATFDPAPLAGRYDLSCAFQVLEHFPFDAFPTLIQKLMVVSRRYVFISLPFSCTGMRVEVTRHEGQTSHRFEEHHCFTPTNLPNRMYRAAYMAEFPWAVHHWEIGREGYSLARVQAALEACGLTVIEQYHAPNPFHYHLLCRRR